MATTVVVEDTKQSVPTWYYLLVLLACVASMVVATQVREFSLSWKKSGVLAAAAAVILSILPHVWAGLAYMWQGVSKMWASIFSTDANTDGKKATQEDNEKHKLDKNDENEQSPKFSSPQFSNGGTHEEDPNFSTPQFSNGGGTTTSGTNNTTASQRNRDVAEDLDDTYPPTTLPPANKVDVNQVNSNSSSSPQHTQNTQIFSQQSDVNNDKKNPDSTPKKGGFNFKIPSCPVQ